MAKFYLHMLPGPELGKVTKLKYIDDISDDELVIFVFDDNSKCAEEYISEINNLEAFSGRYVMTELTDPLNKWQFQTKEFNLTEGRSVIAADGQTYEVPEPGIDRNGDHMSISFTADGDPIARKVSSAGKRTDSIPPRVLKNKRVEPKENYLLSLHPELLDGKRTTNEYDNILSNTVKPINTPQQKVEVDQPNVTNSALPSKSNIPAPTYTNITSPISTNVIETVKHASITIDVDSILKAQEYDKVIVKNGEGTSEYTIEEFIDRLTCDRCHKAEDEAVTTTNENTDSAYTEDILVTNMIDKSKKKVYTIGVEVEMELPPKEVYKTIKTVYPEGMANEFVTCIARRMNSTTLKESLASGLIAYYEIDE